MRDLLKLAERCEAAEAGSFALDKEILAALGYTWRGMDYWYRDDSHTWPGMAALTRSLDAAMTLVPEGWAVEHWQIWPGEPSSLDLLETTRDGDQWVRRMPRLGKAEATAATPALALCAAALRARAEALP